MSKDIHYLGEFNSISDVWGLYPNGGGYGDYITIGGQTIYWIEETRSWGPKTDTGGSGTPSETIPHGIDVKGDGKFRDGITVGEYVSEITGGAIDEHGNADLRTAKIESLFVKYDGDLIPLSEYIKLFKTELPPDWQEYTNAPLFNDIRFLIFDPNSGEKYYTTVKAITDVIKAEIGTGEGEGSGNIQVLREDSDITPTNSNVFSSLRTLLEIRKAVGDQDFNETYLSKLTDDQAQGLITFLQGIKIGEFIPGMFGGKGAHIDNDGNMEATSLRLRAMLEVPELRFNRLTVVGDELILTESGFIESVQHLEADVYQLNMKLEEGENIALVEHDLVKGIFHYESGEVGFSTGYMRVTEVGLSFIKVILAANEDTPTNANFPPMPFMKIARVGNPVDPDRQRYIVASSKLGGFQIYDGASTFKNATLVGSMDTAQSFKNIYPNLPLREGLFYMYAAGLVVQDIIRVDYQGVAVREIFDRGPWESGRTYYNNDTQGTDDVWHLGCRWRCFSSSTTSEPGWTSPHWIMIEGVRSLQLSGNTSLHNPGKPGGVNSTTITATRQGFSTSMTLAWQYYRNGTWQNTPWTTDAVTIDYTTQPSLFENGVARLKCYVMADVSIFAEISINVSRDGEDGEPGEPGENARSLQLSGNTSLHNPGKPGGVNSTTITATRQGVSAGLTLAWQYYKNGIWWTTPWYNDSVTIDYLTQSSLFENGVARLKCYVMADVSIFAETSITVSRDGEDGEDGGPGLSIYLGFNSYTYKTYPNGMAVPKTLSIPIYAYKDNVRQNITASQISTSGFVPYGMSVSKSTNTVTVAVTSNFQPIPGGEGITIHVVLDGATYPLLYNWSVTRDGADGNGIKSIEEYFQRSSSKTSPPPTWIKSPPGTIPGTTSVYRYLWSYQVITYTDNTTYTSPKRVIGTYGDKGDKGDTVVGLPGRDGTNYINFHYWDADTDYYKTNAGIPLVKIKDGTSAGFSVYELKVAHSKNQNPATNPTVWELVESVEFLYMLNAYIENLQFTASEGGGFITKDGKWWSTRGTLYNGQEVNYGDYYECHFCLHGTSIPSDNENWSLTPPASFPAPKWPWVRLRFVKDGLVASSIKLRYNGPAPWDASVQFGLTSNGTEWHLKPMPGAKWIRISADSNISMRATTYKMNTQDNELDFEPYTIIDGRTGMIYARNAKIRGSLSVIHNDGGETRIDGHGYQLINDQGKVNFKTAVENGYVVQKYYDNDGTFLYDIGPAGLQYSNVREERWEAINMVYLGSTVAYVLTNATAKNIYKNPANQTITTYYRYISKINAGVNTDPANDGKIFVSQNKAGSKLPNGVYMRPTDGEYEQFWSHETGNVINPPEMHASNEQVIDRSPIYLVTLQTYSGGSLINQQAALWNGVRDGTMPYYIL